MEFRGRSAAGGLLHDRIKLRKTRDGIFKLLRSLGIDSKELIPPAY
jgi:hypothetical protein